MIETKLVEYGVLGLALAQSIIFLTITKLMLKQIKEMVKNTQVFLEQGIDLVNRNTKAFTQVKDSLEEILFSMRDHTTKLG